MQSVGPVCAPLAMIQQCIPVLHEWLRQWSALGLNACVFLARAGTMQGGAEGRGAGGASDGREERWGCDVYMMKCSSSQSPGRVFPIQKYCRAVREQTSKVQVESRASKHNTAAQRGEE